MECLGLEEDLLPSIEDKDNKKDLFDIVPKEGVFLGLDISKTSSGVTLIENGVRISGNIELSEQKGVHKEVLMRRELKQDLEELVKGKNFDLIIIEDAFVGDNADTVRKLFALNTAIDEMILDGICSCKTFIRVNNRMWKSWLSSIDVYHITKGFNDKEKVKLCLKMIGIEESGKGYQDRLDSTGLIVAYFLKGKDNISSSLLSGNKKVRLSDVEASYETETGYLFYNKDIDEDKIVYISDTKITKKKIIELLTDNPSSVFVTENVVILGNLGIDLGLDIIDDGGYFAFWVKPKRLKKYIQ